jgi:hypothetical protein
MADRSRTRLAAWWFGASALFASCGSATFVVQQYLGPPRPRQTIAIIRVNGGGTPLTSLDGDPLRVEPERGTRFHIEVLPGEHEVGVSVPEPGLPNGVTVRFFAEAGKVYRMEAVSALSEPGRIGLWSAQAFEVDPATDAMIRRAPAPIEIPRLAPPPLVDAGIFDATQDK